MLPRLRQHRLRMCAMAIVMTTLLVVPPQEKLFAVPPVDIDLTETRSVEISWRDTGEKVRLESSDDFGNSDPWEAYPGAPDLIGGRFRQMVNPGGGGTFFRLVGSEVDPTAPTFVEPPVDRRLFPGQSLSFTLSATDPGGKPVRYLAEPLPLPAGATLNRDTGRFTWNPTEEQIGASTITFVAFNGTSSGRVPVSITVEQPPVDGTTVLSGILLDTTDAVGPGADRPVVGAVVSILDSGISMATGDDGRFVLTNVPEGVQLLDIATANARPAPDGSPYAGFREAIRIVEGIANIVERPFYMPRLNTESLTPVNPNAATKVENKTLRVSIIVPPHTAMMDDEEFTGELSISDVPEALAPATLPVNLGFGQLVTIQPVGVRFSQPVPITFRTTISCCPAQRSTSGRSIRMQANSISWEKVGLRMTVN
ncbi:MAG: putative Ig domain-containing protein [Verrucomicrobiales bacterium]